MPISVTCQCGSKLEIDEKFLGKEVPCPDCQRLLPTKAPVVPPPLDLPDNRRTSGLAVLSLALALVGAFTVFGTIAAIVVGVFALREIASKSNKLEGANYARAGIIVGAAFTFVTLAMLVSPTVLGLDMFLRDMAYASRLQYPVSAAINKDIDNGTLEIKRPKPAEAWGEYISPGTQLQNIMSDLLILVNTREDAFIACQTFVVDFNEDDAETVEKGAVERFLKSELAALLNKSKAELKPSVADRKKEDGTQEFILDVRINGVERRCLFLYEAKKGEFRNVLVGVAKRNAFDRMQPSFREAYKDLKITR